MEGRETSKYILKAASPCPKESQVCFIPRHTKPNPMSNVFRVTNANRRGRTRSARLRSRRETIESNAIRQIDTSMLFHNHYHESQPRHRTKRLPLKTCKQTLPSCQLCPPPTSQPALPTHIRQTSNKISTASGATPCTHCASNCALGRWTRQLQHYDEAFKASSSNSVFDNLTALRFRRSFFRFSFFCNCRNVLRAKLTRRNSSWRCCSSLSVWMTALCKAVPLSMTQKQSKGNHVLSPPDRNAQQEARTNPKQNKQVSNANSTCFAKLTDSSQIKAAWHSTRAITIAASSR